MFFIRARALLPGFVFVLLLVFGLPSCNKTKAPSEEGREVKTEPEAKTEEPAKKEKAVDPAVADIPLDESVPEDKAKLPRAPEAALATSSRSAAFFVLVKYAGAKQAPGARRSKDDAQRRAVRLAMAARRKGVDFVTLAGRFSEVPKEERGIRVQFSKGQMESAFEDAVHGMGIGQVSDPVETPFGFYVIQRTEPEEYQTAHILIQYKGAKNAPVAITRGKEDAKTLMERIRKKALEEGASFAVIAARNSDSPSKIRGGVIKPIVPGEMPADYDAYIAAVRALKEDEISPVVETPFGFHIIKRLRLEYISASHILIAWEGSEGTPKEEKRTKRDAEVLAKKAYKEASVKDADFAALAEKYSDDDETAKTGGDLGRFARGMKLPRLEQIAFGLKAGQVSEPVATQFGFHIIKRTQ